LAPPTVPPRPPDHGVTVWFTGLPSAGKTTIAGLVGRRLAEQGRRVELLDGDVVRARLSRGLSFSKADRDENIRRIGYLAGLLTRHGVTVLVSAYRAVRDEVRAEIERVGGFVEGRRSLRAAARRAGGGHHRRAPEESVARVLEVLGDAWPRRRQPRPGERRP
jgi:adenylylsulfate kinase-like enzyme